MTSRDSFPYLHVARRLCADYRQVVCYAAYLDGRPYTGRWDGLNDWDKERIMAVWAEEQRWQQPIVASAA
jgi:hypothetical protein